MSIELMFGALLGIVAFTACAWLYTKFAPRIKRLFSRQRYIDVKLIAKIATCAQSVAVQHDSSGDEYLMFTYRETMYAIRTDCSVSMHTENDEWIVFNQHDGLAFINAMQPRKTKPENNQNSQPQKQQQSKQQNGNSQSNNGINNGKNVIPNDQVEKWYINDKTWDEKPSKFTVSSPYYFRKLPDGGYGIGKNGKS